MGDWVRMRISLEVSVPVEVLSSIAPGLEAEEFLEVYEEDQDEAVGMLRDYLIVGEAVEYTVDFDIEDVEV